TLGLSLETHAFKVVKYFNKATCKSFNHIVCTKTIGLNKWSPEDLLKYPLTDDFLPSDTRSASGGSCGSSNTLDPERTMCYPSITHQVLRDYKHPADKYTQVLRSLLQYFTVLSERYLRLLQYSQRYVRLLQYSQRYVRLLQYSQRYVRLLQYSQRYVRLLQYSQRYVRLLQYSQRYVRLLQYSQRYVRLLQYSQ
ncbi:hypothetical protein JOQ06_022932, partial [Pogonophryne albipinna]